MSLKDLEENLYGQKKVSGNSPQTGFRSESDDGEKAPFEPAFLKAKTEDKSAIWIKQDELKKEKMKKIKKIAAVSALCLVASVGLVWAALYVRKSAFSEDKVSIAISAPEKVQSGDLVNVEISYKNANRVDLKNAVLHIGFTENFTPSGDLKLEPEGPNTVRWNIGTLKKNSEGKLEMPGRFFGTKDMLTYINVKLEYSSANFSSTFAVESKQGILIASSPLGLEVIAPQSVSSGGTVSFSVKYRNDGQQTFRNLKIKAEYPSNFTLANSEPLPEKGSNMWYVGDLEGMQTGEIKISGTLSGGIQEIKQFKFLLGDVGDSDNFIPYSEIAKGIKIIGSPITVLQTVNDSKDNLIVNAGDNLLFRIKFKNTSDVPLRGIVITENISSPVLDYASFRNGLDVQGSLDSEKGILIWNSSGVDKLKALNPGDEGEINFTINVKEVIPVSGIKDKNFSFAAGIRAESSDIPTPEGQNKSIEGNGIVLKVNSKLVVKEEAYYNDPEMTNSGPIPLKVGQVTTFTIRMKAENISNDITDAKIAVTLAPGIEWKNNVLPKDANVDYDSRTNEVIWNIGSMPAGVGAITDPREMAFQVGVKPSENLVGQYVSLTKSAQFSANDAFTGQKLEAKLGEKDSNLGEDISVGGEGKVAR